MGNKMKIQLTQQDYTNILNISLSHNIDQDMAEKLYQEMINKAYAQKKLKAFIEKAKKDLKI